MGASQRTVQTAYFPCGIPRAGKRDRMPDHFRRPVLSHHVDVPVPGAGLRREAVEKRCIAVFEETSIQGKRTELAELAKLRLDEFSHAAADVGRFEFPGVCAPIPRRYLALPSQALAPIPCLKVVPAFPASHRVGCSAG